jgi:hypothetical protein
VVVAASSAIFTVADPAEAKFSVTPGITSEMEFVLRVIFPIPLMESDEFDAADSENKVRLAREAPNAVREIVPFSVPSYVPEITTL